MRQWINLCESTKEFVNELDHDIAITIEGESIDGVPGVNISISGPDSEAENIITRKEAEMLLKELEAFLAEED